MPLGTVRLNMPGRHNVLNALAAISLGLELDISFETIALALQKFNGVERRFTHRGTFHGADVFDDYGHHPREIEATLKVARAYTQKKLVVIFQPHRYTRTQKLWNEFVRVFSQNPPDHLIVTDIYAASEQSIDGVTGMALAQSIGHANVFPVCHERAENIIARVSQIAQPNDLILCLGAGKQVGLIAQQLPDNR